MPMRRAPPVSAYPVDRRSSAAPLLSGGAGVCRAGCCSQRGRTEQYVFARILSAILNEAALALDEGVASREDIDIAMQKGTNYPKGPLAWTDEIGPRTVRGLLKGLSETVAPGR